MSIFKNIFKGVDKADQLIETSQERQSTLTTRHANDMASDNWLSKSIRPLSLLILIAVVSFIGISSTFGLHADPVIFGELSLLLGSAFGFYFDSKKRERIAEKQAVASIKLEEMKTKHEIKKEKKMLRREKRIKRREKREQDG